MVMIEAFRISLGKFQFDRLVVDHHKKELGYKKEVERLLKPLKILDRLHFYRHSDADEGVDWLVVKIESSGQLSLLEGLEQDWSRDLELMRECGAAESLTRVALGAFRKLVALSKMSPTQFHRLLLDGKTESEKGLRMMGLAEEYGDGAVAVRSPQGHDDIARMHPMPRLVTLPEVGEGRFFIHMIGRTSVLVHRVEDKSGVPRPTGRKIELHWGNVPMRDELVMRFYAAMKTREVVTIRNRETLNRKGVVGRLEWCPDLTPENQA